MLRKVCHCAAHYRHSDLERASSEAGLKMWSKQVLEIWENCVAFLCPFLVSVICLVRSALEMGIQGLPNFVRNHNTLSTRVEWTCDDASSDHFVVDGNAFAYHYASKYRNDWTHGGSTLARIWLSERVFQIDKVHACYRRSVCRYS